jgi:hypothetical protein
MFTSSPPYNRGGCFHPCPPLEYEEDFRFREMCHVLEVEVDGSFWRENSNVRHLIFYRTNFYIPTVTLGGHFEIFFFLPKIGMGTE